MAAALAFGVGRAAGLTQHNPLVYSLDHVTLSCPKVNEVVAVSSRKDGPQKECCVQV